MLFNQHLANAITVIFILIAIKAIKKSNKRRKEKGEWIE
jgi:hypothetical protein